MDNVIKTRSGMNGPLGEVTSITGDDAHELLRVLTLASALKLYAETGMKVSRFFSMSLVKSVTKLKTNDKQMHLQKLHEIADALRSKINFVHEQK